MPEANRFRRGMHLYCCLAAFTVFPTLLAAQSTYQIVPAYEISWQQAKDSAIALGGYLASITSAQEQTAAAGVMLPGNYWIGGTDEINKGTWQWVSHDQWAYTNWRSGRPSETPGISYAAMSSSSGNKWIDLPQNYTIDGFIVEKPAAGPYPAMLGFAELYVDSWVGSLQPTISWSYRNATNLPQQAYEIEVGLDSDWTIAELWATGQVASVDTQVQYSGPTLMENEPYYFRARVFDGTQWSSWLTRAFRPFDLPEHSYQLVEVSMTWPQAADSARMAGGYLATIANPLENYYIRSLFPNALPFFVGATDQKIEGAWEWLNGEPFLYSYWMAGQPDNHIGALGGQDYLCVHIENNAAQWDDEVYNALRWSIIERGAAQNITGVIIDGDSNNTHVLSDTPIISWSRVSDTLHQDSVAIEIGTHPDWSVANIWNPPTFVIDDSVITFGGAQLQNGMTYYCRLHVYYSGVTSPIYYTSFRMNTAPVAPTLQPTIPIYPFTTPAISVPHGTDAENDSLLYFIEAYYDSSLTTLAVYDSSGYYYHAQNADWIPSIPLTENATIWWRCRLFDLYEFSAWSNIGAFQIDAVAQAPAAPILTSPLDQPGSSLFDLTPLMQWQTSIDPDPVDFVRYKLEIDTDTSFASARVYDSLTTIQFTVSDSLIFGKHYYWRVTAFDTDGLRTKSVVGNFWTWMLGDINHSHTVTISDLTYLVAFLFNGGAAISPLFAGDLNHSCTVTISDLTYLVNFLFNGGPAPKVGCGP